MKRAIFCLVVFAASFALNFAALSAFGNVPAEPAVGIWAGTTAAAASAVPPAALDLWELVDAALTLLGAAVVLASLVAPFTATTTDDRIVAVLKSLLARLSLVQLGALRATPKQR
jgi:hypothetical protein